LIYKVQRCRFSLNKLIIDKKRPKSCEDMILSREVVVEKDTDGKDVLKIAVKASRLEGGGGKLAT
jgi:hypothetical protein